MGQIANYENNIDENTSRGAVPYYNMANFANYEHNIDWNAVGQ